MIRKQFLPNKQRGSSAMQTKFNVTFSRRHAESSEDPQEQMQQALVLRRRQLPFTSRRKSFEKSKFYTQPINWLPNHSESNDSYCQLLAQDLQPSFLPFIQQQRKFYHSNRKNSEINNDWIDKLTAKQEVKRIYAQESRRAQQEVKCWKRIKARANLLKEIKRQKRRLIALYERQ